VNPPCFPARRICRERLLASGTSLIAEPEGSDLASQHFLQHVKNGRFPCPDSVTPSGPDTTDCLAAAPTHPNALPEMIFFMRLFCYCILFAYPLTEWQMTSRMNP